MYSNFFPWLTLIKANRFSANKLKIFQFRQDHGRSTKNTNVEPTIHKRPEGLIPETL